MVTLAVAIPVFAPAMAAGWMGVIPGAAGVEPGGGLFGGFARIFGAVDEGLTNERLEDVEVRQSWRWNRRLVRGWGWRRSVWDTEPAHRGLIFQEGDDALADGARVVLVDAVGVL